MQDNQGTQAASEAASAPPTNEPASGQTTDQAPGQAPAATEIADDSPDIETTGTLPSPLTPAEAEDMRKRAFEAATKGQKMAPAAEDETEEQEPETKPPASGTPQRGPDGKFLPRPQPTTVKPPGSDRTKPVPPAVEAERRAQSIEAERVLRRSGLTPDEIALLKPERVQELVQRHRQEQSAGDALRSRMGRLEAEVKRLGGNAGVSSGSEAAPRRQPAERNPLDEFLDELDTPGEGATGVEQEAPASGQDPQAVRTELYAARGEIALASLLGEFPGLKDRENLEAVFRQMDRFDPQALEIARGTEAFTLLMRDAANAVLGPHIRQQARDQARQRNQAARSGQPDTGTINANPPAKKPSKEDIYKAAFEASTTISDPAEVRRKVNEKLGREG